MYKQYQSYKQYISDLLTTSKCRKLLQIRQDCKKNYLDFSTNDYLGLSCNPEILEAGITAARTYGIGATGSRLLSGNNELFESLELRIAKDKHTEAALIFNTGFQTNFSALAALLDHKILGRKPLVFFDKLNHSSLYQAIFLTNPDLIRYNHNDMEHLESLLVKYQNHDQPKFIVAETIFGMDGDVLPIEQIVTLARNYQTFLYLDEAHATGILGPHGYGLSTSIDLTGIPAIIMGTFSKALGCSGGYVACDQVIKDYLINKAAGFIYSTANSPMIVGVAAKAWEMIKDFTQERQHLFALSNILRNKLLALGFELGASNSHIFPIIVKEEELALQIKEQLYQNKILVSCIRPPTVPPNSSRIRVALSSVHREEDIELFINVLKILC